MSNEYSMPLSPAAVRAARLERGLRAAAIVIAGSAFVAVCAHVSLPLFFTPVPLTLQPFAVLMLGLLLSLRMAAATLAAYLAEGVLGLPVFAVVPRSQTQLRLQEKVEMRRRGLHVLAQQAPDAEADDPVGDEALLDPVDRAGSVGWHR